MKPTMRPKRFFKLLLLLLSLSIIGALCQSNIVNVLMLSSFIPVLVVGWRYFWSPEKESLKPMLVATVLNVALAFILLFVAPTMDPIILLSSIMMISSPILAGEAMKRLGKDPRFLEYIGITGDGSKTEDLPKTKSQD